MTPGDVGLFRQTTLWRCLSIGYCRPQCAAATIVTDLSTLWCYPYMTYLCGLSLPLSIIKNSFVFGNLSGLTRGQMWQNHDSLRRFMVASDISWRPVTCWQTQSFVSCSRCDMPDILLYHLFSKTWIRFSRSESILYSSRMQEKNAHKPREGDAICLKRNPRHPSTESL